MITCPNCKTSFSEIDEPCKKCNGARLVPAKSVHGVGPESVSIDLVTKLKPCPRCNGNGVERSAKNRNNRQRGASNEAKAVKTFTEWWTGPSGEKFQFKRTPQSGGAVMAIEFNQAGDICTNDPNFPFHVECKRDKGWDISQLLTTPNGCARLGTFATQALTDCSSKKFPILWLMKPGPSQPTFIMLLQYSLPTIVGSIRGEMFIEGQCIPYTMMSLKTFLSQGPDYWRRMSNGLFRESQVS